MYFECSFIYYDSHNTYCKEIFYFGDVVILKKGDVMIKSNFIGFFRKKKHEINRNKEEYISNEKRKKKN